MKKIILCFLVLCLTPATFALTLKPLEGTKIEVKVPYTFGTHDITSSEMTGSVDFDIEKSLINSGTLRVDISNLKNKDEKLQCHLRESIGLDYDQSEFPDDHVCDDDNKLPSEGKNAIAYKEIVAQVITPIASGEIEVPVSWTIHGKTQQLPTKLQTTWNPETKRLLIEGKITFKRKDFGIIVKKFLFVAVDEEIPVNFKVELGENK